MGATFSNLKVLGTRCNQERSSIARLRELLPPGIFALVVKRISKGDTLTSISIYLNSIQRDISSETFRKWLQPLATEVRELLAEETPLDDVVKTIEDRNAATASPGVGRPQGPSAGSAKRLKAVVKRACQDINSEMMLRYAWAVQQKRVDRMADLETRLGVVLPGLHREIDTLRGIAESLVKFEVGKNFTKNKIYEIPETPPPEPGSMAERISRFDFADRNLIRTAATHVIEMIEEECGRALTEADLQAAGEKVEAVIPEGEDHDQRREIGAEPLPPEEQLEKPSCPGKQTNATQENNPPRKIPDLFQFG